MKDFKRLVAWEKAHQLALSVYRATQAFPREEIYGLTNQMRRASVSIPSNTAEGCGRNSNAELARFLEIAMGSSSELEYQLLLARDFHYLDTETYPILDGQLVEVRRILNALIHKVRSEV